MAANGTTALDALNWGISTLGAAGLAETTSTLGVDRTDNRVPPDTYHIWAAQLNAAKALLIAMSQFYLGGCRLKSLQQTANPFGFGDTGFYVDNTNSPNPWACFSSLGSLYYFQVALALKPGVGGALASAATITPTNLIHHVTGTTTVSTISVPAGFNASVTLIPDGLFVTNTAGNIALASTAVVSKALIMTYDTNTSKFYPSY